MKYFMKVKPSYNITIGGGSSSTPSAPAPIDEEAVRKLIKEETANTLTTLHIGTKEDVQTIFKGGSST